MDSYHKCRARGRAGLGPFIEEPQTVISFRLPDHSTILPAEIRVIADCLNWLNVNTRPATFNVPTDCKIAIKVIT